MLPSQSALVPDSRAESVVSRTVGYRSVIGLGSSVQTNRQRVILLVHRRLYTITLLDFSHHPGRCICVQTDFLPVLHFNEIVPVFDAEQFAVDRLGTF